MMTGELMPRQSGLASEKIRREHRERLAIVYVRQSTIQQIERHQESTRLQYALVDRAFQLGWARENIVVIDDDLGRSGATAEGRLGFQRLVAQVGLDKVGLVLGIEMSRLARSCRDWHQLLEICALFDTLIADADGVYDPTSYNDRLLLGLKGTMSEAELHIIKARMLEGRRAKAARGELGRHVPMGYVRRLSGEIVLDPDEQAQTTIRLVFDLFERWRTIGKVMSHFAKHDIRLPVRVLGGPNKGELEWRRPSRPTLQNLLTNPIYAGAYVYGMRSVDRRRQKPGRPGTGRRPPHLDNAAVVLPDRLPAYITWDQYQRNLAQLQANRAGWVGAPRAGTALLSGVLVCGRCGLRMRAYYSNNGSAARYMCCDMKSSHAEPPCQSLKAAPLDRLLTEVVLEALQPAALEALQPAALEASLALAADLDAERAALERHWQQRRERARYEVERARRQYGAVEPENRLVARTLEKAWEEALAEQGRLEADYERFLRDAAPGPSPADLATIRGLAQDLPALWSAGTTTQEERQTIVRLLLERVLVEVVDGTEQVRVECHWHGGNRTRHQLVRPVARLDALSTYPDLVARAAGLHHEGHGYPEIAEILNREGWRPAKRRDTFNAAMVNHLLLNAGIVERKYHRGPRPIKRDPDEWTIRELAEEIGMPEPTLYTWVQQGRLPCRLVETGGKPAKLVHADAASIAALKEIRAVPAPWHRRPPVLPSTRNPTES